MTTTAPFPWFGGKSRAAHLVWAAFGAGLPNYVEPFAGSLAVLLARPDAPRIETVNDLDCYLANAWRAIAGAPAEVAAAADWPVNEADLHARHRWLVDQLEFRERMKTDPAFFDAKIAGWWLWGVAQWIGGGWCEPPKWSTGRVERRRPQLGKGGKGVTRQIPSLSGDGGATGRGVHASGKSDAAIREWMTKLSLRLRRVRVCCGDWQRVLGRSPTECIGVTGIFLDPPYSAEAGRDNALYAQESTTVAHDVREWAIDHGDNPRLRIALCGYEGEHTMPASWQCVPWKAAGGYGNQRGGEQNPNAKRERIWFSPACLPVVARQPSLFAGGAA